MSDETNDGSKPVSLIQVRINRLIESGELATRARAAILPYLENAEWLKEMTTHFQPEILATIRERMMSDEHMLFKFLHLASQGALIEFIKENKGSFTDEEFAEKLRATAARVFATETGFAVSNPGGPSDGVLIESPDIEPSAAKVPVYKVTINLARGTDGQGAGLLTPRGKEIIDSLDPFTRSRLKNAIRAQLASSVEDSKTLETTVDHILRIGAEKVAREEEGKTPFEGTELLRQLNVQLGTITIGDRARAAGIAPTEPLPEPTEEILFGQANKYTHIAMHLLQKLDDATRAELNAVALNKVRFMNGISKEMRAEGFIGMTAGLLVQQAAEMLVKDGVDQAITPDALKAALTSKIETEKFEVAPEFRDR